MKILTIIFILAFIHSSSLGDEFYIIESIVKKNKFVQLEKYLNENPHVINSKNNNGEPLINKIIQLDSVRSVKIFIKAGVELNIRDSKGRTPLHLASGWSSTGMVFVLLEGGSDPNAHTKSGRTPTHYAIYNSFRGNNAQRDSMLKVLADYGAIKPVLTEYDLKVLEMDEFTSIAYYNAFKGF